VEFHERGEGLASPLEVCEARVREVVHHHQEALYGFTALEATIRQLEVELAHFREIERKAKEAVITFLAFEARLAGSATHHFPSPTSGEVTHMSSVPAIKSPLVEETKPRPKTGSGKNFPGA
jgi:hypothetical protein